jgi:RNA polymerase sigma-70 factor (ECF subfamily)
MDQQSQRNTWFLTTCWDDLDAIKQGGEGTQDAFDRFCRTYWMPVYSFLRKSGQSPEEAADLTQGFFERMIQRDDLKSFQRGTGMFRSWLLVCLRRFAADNWRTSTAAQRRPGGGFLSLDSTEAESSYLLELIEAETPDRVFDRRWALNFFNEVLEQIGEECRVEGEELVFQHFVAHLAGTQNAVPHHVAAANLGKTVGTLKNDLTALRKRLAAMALGRLTLTLGSRTAAELELKYLVEVASGL